MFKKPTTKNAGTQALTIGVGVAGAALSDGVVGLVPEQYAKWGKPALALATAILAAATKTNTTGGKVLQAGFAGMSIKQGLETLREMVSSKIPVQDAETQVGKFTNGILGLASADTPLVVPQIINAGQAPSFNHSNMLASADMNMSDEDISDELVA